MTLKNNSFPALLLILAVSFFVRIVLAPLGTLESDFLTFVSWSKDLAKNGFWGFYLRQWSDYLPGYLYILWFLGKIGQMVPGLSVIFLYKLPAIIADVGTGFLIYQTVLGFKKKFALWAASFYLFNPAIFANSSLWGQVDGLVAFFSLGALAFSKKRPFFSSIFLALGTLVKPQTAFIAPLVLLVWFKNIGLRSLIYISIGGLLFITGFLPFYQEANLFNFALERMNITANQYPYASVNAFNVWAIFPGFWKEDGWLAFVSSIMFFILLSVVVLRCFKEKSIPILFLAQSLIMLSSFLFLTRMHERHLLPTLAPLAISAAAYPALWWPYLVLSATYVANLYFSFVWITQVFRWIFSQETIVFFVLANILAFGIMGIFFLKNKKFRVPFFDIKKILLGILVFAFLSRILVFWYPETFYFDEVYHAFTAREMLRGNQASWEWWNTPPEGFAYEWSHPPLAKLFMAGSMAVLGQNPVGWRLPGAIIGTLTVLLVFLLGRELFKRESVGILAAAVFSLDGLPLVMSRIGMNDIYFLFFALFSIWLFFKKRFFLSAFCLGLALSSKWTAVWILPIIFAVMWLLKIKPRFKIFLFFFLPPAVYLASYFGFFLSGHSFAQFIELQQQMWWYHTNLEATHPYQSSWWSWPLLLRPVWLFAQENGGLVANIYAMGNPLVFWSGLAALGIMGVVGVIKKQKKLLFVFMAWGLFFLPWALSPRIMFLYHYLPALPFLSLALGWFLSFQNKKLVTCYLLLVTIVYLFFFPHWTGIFVPRWLDELYYWMPGWR